MATSGFFITYLFHLGIGKGNQAFKFFTDGMSSESIHEQGPRVARGAMAWVALP